MTIREISKITGLSSTTICKAFKDPKSVKKQTWGVLKPFLSNPIGTIAFEEIHIILPNISNSFFAEILFNILDTLYDNNASAIIHLSNDEEQREKDILANIPQNFKTGIIWLPSSHANATTLSKTLKQHIVVIDRDVDHPSLKIKVLSDNYHMAQQATSLLFEGYARNPALINGFSNTYTAVERERGFTYILEKKGLSSNGRVFYGEFSDEYLDYQVCLSVLERNKFDSFVLGNQTIAYSFLKAIKKLEIKIPEDITCITFDYLPNKDILIYPLSMVVLPAAQIGKKACELLLNCSLIEENTIKYILEGSIYLNGSEKKII